MPEELFEFVRKLDGCTNADAVWQLLADWCTDKPFDSINFVHMHNEEFFAIGSGPQDYLKHYNEANYADDDHLLNALMNAHAPIVGGREYQDILPCQSDRSMKVMMDAREAGMSVNSVLAVPILSGEKRSVMSALADTSRKEFDPWLNANGGWAVSALLYAQLKLLDFTTDLPRLPAIAALTPRQMEVVKWMAEGLQNDQIAEKMTISYDGVSYHLKRIKEKLGVNSRREILPKALKSGLIKL